MADQRNHRRIALGVRCADKNNLIRGFTRNLSAGGCFIKTSEECPLLPVGSIISFALEIPGDFAYIELEGMVKHHGKEGDGVGISFMNVNPGVHALIEHFVQNHA